MMDRELFVSAAREYMGTPFMHQGRSKEYGVDCAGLLLCSLSDIGIDVPDCRSYARMPNGDEIYKELSKYLTPKPINQVITGDLLLMKFIRYPQHVAIVTDIGILHSYERIGQVVEHSLDQKWKSRTIVCFDLDTWHYG